MKRLLPLLIALMLVLCGCFGDREAGSGPVTESTTIPTTEPEPQPIAVYEPDSNVEIITAGAVKRYVLNQTDYYSFSMMGEGMLLFSGDEETTLTYLSENGIPLRTTLTGCYIKPGSASVRVTDDGVGYYDSTDHTLVFLDTALKETSRMSLPSDMVCDPLLSQDWQWLYYYVGDSLRSLELKTGISRLLQESNYETQTVKQLHFNGTVLECQVTNGEVEKTLFISTETGKNLFNAPIGFTFYSSKQEYFVRWNDTEQWLLLFGDRGGKISQLKTQWEGVYVPQLEHNFMAMYQTDICGTTLMRYTLERDKQAASVRLNGVGAPMAMGAQSDSGLIWFLANDLGKEGQALYVWDHAASNVAGEWVFPYYTEQDPDTAGLEACIQRADELGKQYGVKIRLWKDAVKTIPEGCSLTPEYKVAVYERYLKDLETALKAFPKEIYQKLSKQSENGKLTISLVKEVSGGAAVEGNTQDKGIHFWNNASSYLTISMQDTFVQDFYHAMCHAIDSYVMTETKAFDYWNDMNPKGFAYDYSYITNAGRDPGSYLEDDSRAFIDVYSMSYPKEDRARIMEYAMQEGNEAYFTSKIMSKKLKTLCQGIRQAFKLKDEDVQYLWEQYL